MCAITRRLAVLLSIGLVLRGVLADEKPEARFPIGYGAWFAAEQIPCGEVAKKGIFMHPPWEGGASGKVLGSFDLNLPKADGLALVMSIGIKDEAPGAPSGVRYEVRVNGKEIFRQELLTAGGWKEVKVDLAQYSGQHVAMELAVDSMGATQGDWAAIGEPRIVTKGGVLQDLTDLAPKANPQVVLDGLVGAAALLDRELQQEPQLLVNQAGYDSGASNFFLVQAPVALKLPGQFRVKTRGDKGVVLEGKLDASGGVKSWRGLWTGLTYAAGDISAIAKTGEYVIEIPMSGTNIVSVPFTVGKDQLFKTLVPFSGLAFLKGRREAGGGWKSDQVEMEKRVVFAIAPSLYGLARTMEVRPGFWKAEGKEAAAIEEIRWGLKGLCAAQKEDGRFVGSNADGRDDVYAGVGIAALACLSRAGYLTAEERKDCLQRAQKSWGYYKDNKKFEKWGSSALDHALLVLGDVELYRVSKDRRHLEDATAKASAAAAEWEKTWPMSVGWATEIWQGGIVPGSLLALALEDGKSLPKDAESMLRRWLDRVRKLTRGNVVSPFGVVPWDETHVFNPNTGGWIVGENGRYITYTWALTLAARWAKDDSLYTLATRQLDWIGGVNPSGRSLIKGVGAKSWQNWFGCIGSDPGAIINGFRPKSAQDDSPFLNDTGYYTIEPWTPYNGWLMIALAERAQSGGNADSPTPDGKSR